MAHAIYSSFFSSGACACGADSIECRESLALQVLFADLPHSPQGAFSCPCGAIHLVSPNPIYALRGCGPLSTLGFFDRYKGPCGHFLFSARLFHVEHFSAFIYLFYVEH